MKILKRADGWAGVPYRLDVTESEVENNKIEQPRNGNSWWNRLFDQSNGWINSIFNGVTSVTQAKTGNYPEYREDSTPKILAISAVAAIVLVVILLIIFKK